MANVGNFPTRYKGQSCIICGSAPSLFTDFEKAMELYPNSIILAVNESCSHVHADHIVTFHYDRMSYFKNISRNKKAVTHCGRPYDKATFSDIALYEDTVDYWWENASTQGTSVMCAMMIADQMCFDKIVLAGAPMNGGDGYFNDGKTLRGKGRFGYGGAVKMHQNGFMRSLTPKLKEKTESMSGWTKEVLNG